MKTPVIYKIILQINSMKEHIDKALSKLGLKSADAKHEGNSNLSTVSSFQQTISVWRSGHVDHPQFISYDKGFVW